MTLPEIDHVSFLVEHAQTFFAGERANQFTKVKELADLAIFVSYQPFAITKEKAKINNCEIARRQEG